METSCILSFSFVFPWFFHAFPCIFQPFGELSGTEAPGSAHWERANSGLGPPRRQSASA